MISRHLDEDTGIIYVSAPGAWTRRDVDEHYTALREMIEKLRAEGRKVRVLSDTTNAPRQIPSIEDHIMEQMSQTYRAGDRVVILTANADDKAYIRHLVGKADVAAFASRLPAEMWLLLDEVNDSGQVFKDRRR